MLLSKLVNVRHKGVQKAVKERPKILSREKKSSIYLERKTRGDAVSQEVKQLFFFLISGRTKPADQPEIKRMLSDKG